MRPLDDIRIKPLMRTRIKICGFTVPDQAVTAAQWGADAIGLVFYPPSPRHVTAQVASAVCAVLPPFVSAVGLFVDADADEVRSVLRQVPLTLLQFHGDEARSIVPSSVCHSSGGAGSNRGWICYNTRAISVRRADCCSTLMFRACPAVPANASTGR